MFKPKVPQQEQGFTLVEVLVAILVIALFVAVAMQGMVIAALFKARAQQLAKATTWIQEDLENVKSQAAKLQYTSLTLAANPTTGTVLNVASVDGFQAGDTLTVGTDSTGNTIAAGGVNTTAKTITLTAALDTSWSAGTVVVATKNCNPTSGTPNLGFAKYLQDKLPALPNSGEQPILGKKYILTRTPTITNVSPYEVLKLTYSVAPENAHTTLTNIASATSNTLNVASGNGFKTGNKLTVGTDTDNLIESVSGNTITLKNLLGSDQPIGTVVDVSIATVNTEVIPNAAFKCPQS